MPTTSRSEPWLRGVAANPAAPAELLLRLLVPQARAAWAVLCEHRSLPPEVVEAVLAHPAQPVRRAFARNRFATPAQRGRLVDDPDDLVRVALVQGPRPKVGPPEPLPDEVLERLLTVRDDELPNELLTADEIRQELAFSGQTPQSFNRRLPTHPDPDLRAQGADLWLRLTPDRRAALLADPDGRVRAAARRNDRVLDPAATAADLPDQDCHHRSVLLANYAVSRAVAERCLADRRNLWGLAGNRFTPRDIVARLARDPDPKVRQRVAARADLAPGLLAELARDPDPAVRARARVHPLPRTWPEQAAIDRVVTGRADCIGPLPEMFLEPPTRWYESCAAATDPVLRRTAATCRELPARAVARLAADQDPEVRHLLAYHHPSAPPAIVLEAFLATPRQRPYLLTLARLPRTGLGHLLDHADPEVRALAATDATLPEPPVRLLADPDPAVRRAAAAHPLLPPDLLAGLLTDPDPELAEGAAANPALPVERLRALVEAAVVGAG
ncbi:hypothetical protein ACFW1A_29455 [Kitasatospora sp. NPDC058965]|uniref:hypothetical protein n=1 Tax=Kitasatospora sp. NPDC058965 TaxID=3346682 RepID=UPI0036A3A969